MRFVALLAFLCAACAAQPADWRLTTAAADFRFAADGGGIASLIDRADGRDLAAPGKRPQLFELAFTDPKDPAAKRTSLTNTDSAALTGVLSTADGARTLTLTWRNLAGRGVEVVATFTARANDPLLRCRLSTSFPAGMALEFTKFPVISLAAPLHGGGDDAFVCGNTKGGVHHRPSAWKTGRWQGYGQPGNLAAAFGCYYDAAGGVYTAALDSLGTPKGIAAARGADGLVLQWYAGCYALARYEVDYDLVLAPFHGQGATDWRDAADLYRLWARQQPWAARTLAQRADLPEWIRSGPAMVRFNRDWMDKPADIKAWLRDYYQRFFPGVPLCVAYWGWEKVDTWITPDYFPCYPDDATFTDITAFVRGIGGHSMLWPSGYHYTMTYNKRPDGTFAWDDRARFDADIRPHAVMARSGQMQTRDPSWLRGGQTATMCPGDPWTIDWFNHLAEEMTRRGVEMVQIDQVVGGSYPACYDPRHGHPLGPGRWQTEAFRRQLTTMRDACEKLDPAFVACYEEPNEWYLDQIGWQDYRDWEVLGQADVEPASVFGYVYHEYVPQFQSNPRAGDRLMLAYQLVNGQVPQFVPSRAVGPGPLLDGGFEAFSGGVPTGWEKVGGWQGVSYDGQSARDTDEKHGGAASLRLTNTGAEQIVQVSRNLAVGASLHSGRTYRLSAWLRSRDVARPGGIIVGLFAPELKSVGGANLPYPPAADGWRQVSAEFTVPPSAEMMRLMLHLQGPGTVWIDDLTLAERGADGVWTELARPDRPVEHELMAQWVALFHGAGRPYLLLGRMMPPPALACARSEQRGRSWPAIMHNAWQAADGSRAVVMVNITEEQQTGRLSWAGREQELTLAPWEVRLVR